VKTSASAVPDTNIGISYFLSPRSVPAAALKSLRGRYRVLGSLETITELQDVFMRDKFSKIPRAKREALLASYIEALEILKPHITITACRHPPDDKFLSLAVSGNASLILTGDSDLLVLHPFRGIAIVNPAGYLAL
jgi:uncharacterized protein